MQDDEGWWGFVRLCHQTKDVKQLGELFDLFLTIEERRDIGLRLALVEALLKGEKAQREIAADLHVSIAKISRGSNALKTISRNLKRMLIEAS